MRTILHLCFVAAISALLVSPAIAQRPGDAVPGRYIVEVRGQVDAGIVAWSHGLAPDRIYRHAVNGFAGFIPPGQLKRLAADPDVVSIVPDRLVSIVAKPDKTGKPSPDTSTSGQVVPAGVLRIGADRAWAIATGLGVGVAIVDTGIDFNHPDLNVASESFTAYIGTAQDDHGHGTHVAGIVAALNNDLDVVGVAPNATLYAVKVLDSRGSGYDSDIIAGLEWIFKANSGVLYGKPVSPAIRVVNMSLGRPGSLDDSLPLHTAVKNLYDAGITVVVAAGNDYDLEVKQQVPATYPEVIAVASTTAKKGTSKLRGFRQGIAADTASYFTTDGKFENGIGVTISAPGEDQEDVNSAGFISSVGILSLKLGGGTTRMSGTSMASPHVAGVVAQLVELNSSRGPEDIRYIIRSNASRDGTAPLDSPTSAYTYDDEREGIVLAP